MTLRMTNPSLTRGTVGKLKHTEGAPTRASTGQEGLRKALTPRLRTLMSSESRQLKRLANDQLDIKASTTRPPDAVPNRVAQTEASPKPGKTRGETR